MFQKLGDSHSEVEEVSRLDRIIRNRVANMRTIFCLSLTAIGLWLVACTPPVANPTPPAAAPTTPPSPTAPITATVALSATAAPSLVLLPTPTPDAFLTVQPTATPASVAAPPSTATVASADRPVAALPYSINLPPGFQIAYFAQNIQNARSLALGANGTVFVGSRQAGNVYALVDRDSDGQAEQMFTIASGLNSPNGVAVYADDLYVAEIGRIIRFDAIEANLAAPPAPVIVNQEFPSDTWHGWKYLRVGPDGYLYTAVGAPCNVCEISGLYGALTRLRPDGSGLEVYARGIRNTVGFDWHPQTGELWFTDNGHDALGDDLPPDELNHAPQPGLHFGFPACHGSTILDPEFGAGQSCADFMAPAIALGPHVAALGMRFYTGDLFPAEYQNQIFIAEHGSFARSTPIGYRITLVRLTDGQATAYEPFADGWLQNGEVLGRPVDLLILPDGSLLVSDDTANAIYRIRYQASS